MERKLFLLALCMAILITAAVSSAGTNDTLTVNAVGNGAGTVSSFDGRINFRYPEVTWQSESFRTPAFFRAVAVTATGNGSRVDWSGRCDFVAHQSASSSTCFIFRRKQGLTPPAVKANFTSCQPSLEQSFATFPSGGGTGDIDLLVQMPKCSWAATSDAGWISVTSATSGSGVSSYSITYSVEANTTDMIRKGTIKVAGLTYTVVQGPSSNISKIGIFHNGIWYLDTNGDGIWNPKTSFACPDCPVHDLAVYDTVFPNFGTGLPDAKPVMGDWDGHGIKRAGIFSNGVWHFDLDYSGILDEQVNYTQTSNTASNYNDPIAVFGQAGDVPVVGDWNGDGRDKIGVFRNGTWYLDLNGNGFFDGCEKDACHTFGQAGDIPVVGDWNGDGRDKIGVFRQGIWYLDMNGDGVWKPAAGCPPGAECFAYSSGDISVSFGLPSDIPVVGNWTGRGKSKIGVYRNGTWYLYMNDVGQWKNGEVRTINGYGGQGWLPVVGN